MTRQCAYDSLWKKFFKNPSLWWDNRGSKSRTAHPDFRHKVTKESLWIDGLYNPSWVAEELRQRGLAQAVAGKTKDCARFVTLLRACTKSKDFCRGRRVHDIVLRRGLLEGCSDALITMYAKCGELVKAKELLDKYNSKDLLTWTALIAGYAKKGHGQDALNYFEKMQNEGLSPDSVTYTCILKACGSLQEAERGEKIHDEIVKQGLLRGNVVLGTAVLDMYAKCGALAKARCVFEELPTRSVISWTALIAGYAEHGEGEQALMCYDRMQQDGISPNAVTYSCILKACGGIRAAEKGKEIHDEVAKQGLLGNNIVLGTALVDMYAKCGALTKARRVLEELPARDVLSWTALIAGYAEHGEGEEALNCFQQMKFEGLTPDEKTFVCILTTCANTGALGEGEEIHEEVDKQGLLGTNTLLGTILVDMYAKGGAIDKARRVLEELPARDASTWTPLITAYAEHGPAEQALSCLAQMRSEGLAPHASAFASILKACGNLGAIDKGEEYHLEIAKRGLMRNDLVLGTALVAMYAKCGVLSQARKVLEDLPVRDVSSWTALITGYTDHGHGEQALQCYDKMQREGLSPDVVTFLCVLKACGSIKAIDKGEEIHDEMVKRGILRENNMLSTTLVDMYAKCGALAKAQGVLEQNHVRDVSAWTALITGYTEHGKSEQALDCFELMHDQGLSPDKVTYICILKACGSTGAVEKGERVHEEIANQGLLGADEPLDTALVDMYIKCGALTKARQVVEQVPIRNVVAWTTLIVGYAQQGQSKQALSCFDQMEREGLSPDGTTFSCVLSACSHLGLVDDAETYFGTMITKYGIKPDVEHYTCIVDVFGRAGHLDRAVEVIKTMHSSCDVAWSSLLSACQKWGDVDIGRWVFERAVEVDKSEPSVYVLMAKIYAAAGMQKDADLLETMRLQNEACLT